MISYWSLIFPFTNSFSGCVFKKSCRFNWKSRLCTSPRILLSHSVIATINYVHTRRRYSRTSSAYPKMVRKWAARVRIPPRALTRGALPIVRDNYRINKFTSWRNAYNISTSAKWYRDTVVYHRGSYSPRPVTHCRRTSSSLAIRLARIHLVALWCESCVTRDRRHWKIVHVYLGIAGDRAARTWKMDCPPARTVAKLYSGGKSEPGGIKGREYLVNYINISSSQCHLKKRSNIHKIM